MITGERVSTDAGGFNPTYQRHVAAYRLCAPLLPAGRVLDLGCGTGHSYRELAPRDTVGVDLDADALAGQERETVRADMRRLPFGDGSFQSVLSVQSIEHVPDPEAVLREVVRVLEPSGRAVFVTPNRLTFGRPDEIIDPYHYVEYDATQLGALCAPFFAAVDLAGIHGSAAYEELVAAERTELARLLALDPLQTAPPGAPAAAPAALRLASHQGPGEPLGPAPPRSLRTTSRCAATRWTARSTWWRSPTWPEARVAAWSS